MEKIESLLNEFVIFVKNKIDEAITKKEIKQVEVNQEYFKWKLNEHKYSMDTGPVYGAMGQTYTKKQIFYSHNLETQLKDSENFNIFVKNINEIYPSRNIKFELQSFLSILIQNYLDNKNIDKELVNLFIKELNDEPIKVKAIIQLRGITLDENPIKLSNSCILRRISYEELEKEYLLRRMPFLDFDNTYDKQITAILEIEKEVLNNNQEIHNEIEKAILILRLFKIGSVQQVSYQTLSNSIIKIWGGTTISGLNEHFLPREILKIYEKDYENLKLFWKEFNSLDYNILLNQGAGNLNNIQFSYQRYCEVIFSITTLEQKVASIIIGLESLYLNNSEELSRFLRLRISKFLSLGGFNPQRVQNILKFAYDIRSYFVHGNKLDYKKMKKIRDKYNTEDNFLKEVLEYLRISIIILLSIHKSKDEIIDLIDDSFIDKTKEKELENLIKNITQKFHIIHDSN